MLNKIKEYLEYRRNTKIVKRELTKIAAATLPAVRSALNEVSAALHTDNNRIMKILTYMSELSPEDIQKILVHSVVETLPKDNKQK